MQAGSAQLARLIYSIRFGACLKAVVPTQPGSRWFPEGAHGICLHTGTYDTHSNHCDGSNKCAILIYVSAYICTIFAIVGKIHSGKSIWSRLSWRPGGRAVFSILKCRMGRFCGRKLERDAQPKLYPLTSFLVVWHLPLI